jgi:hypothetical protein
MDAAAELERAAQEIAKLQDALRSRDALLQTLEVRCQEQVRPFANSKPQLLQQLLSLSRTNGVCAVWCLGD